MTMKNLFIECAFKGGWTTINNVDYKFVEKGDTLELHFMGSFQWQDWVFNFLFKKKMYGLFKVHRGFLHCWLQVRNIILDKIYNGNYSNIIVVGYSHGGSLCQLAHQELVYHFPNLDVKSYAFESPRCLKVPKKYKFYWNTLIRITNGTDLITHLPPKLFGFDDLGNEIKIKGDTSLVKNKLPRCIKYHYPQCVENGLENINRTDMIIEKK